jgi:hypothetical protein
MIDATLDELAALTQELEEAARDIETALRHQLRELRSRFAKWLYRLEQNVKIPELRGPDWR